MNLSFEGHYVRELIGCAQRELGILLPQLLKVRLNLTRRRARCGLLFCQPFRRVLQFILDAVALPSLGFLFRVELLLLGGLLLQAVGIVARGGKRATVLPLEVC